MSRPNGYAREPICRPGRPRKGERAFLASVGISKRTSMQAQALASLPPELVTRVAKRQMSLTEAVKIAVLARRIAASDEEIA